MTDRIQARGRSGTVSETQRGARDEDTAEERCVAPAEATATGGCTPRPDRIRLRWEDIEAHRHALSDLQWRRITQYFYHGMSLSQIHAGTERARQTANTSTEQCLGRASIRLLRSMLGMTITEPLQGRHFRKEIAASPAREPDGAMALALLRVLPDREARREAGFTVSEHGEEIDRRGQSGGHQKIRDGGPATGSAGRLTEAEAATELVGRVAGSVEEKRLETRKSGDDDSGSVMGLGSGGIAVGMRVEREDQGNWEGGRVLEIDGATATVSWDLGGETRELLIALRAIPMR